MENTFTLLLYGTSIALFFSIIGFFRTVWFISIGYTLSIVALCAGLALFYLDYFELYNWLQIAVLGIWGIRLGSFLIKRELNANYNEVVKDQTDASQNQSIFVKISIWIGVSILYMMMFSPAIFTLQKPTYLEDVSSWLAYSGVVVMLLGLTIESIADRQKSIFKGKNPKQYCDIGLYKWVRCPNYLGEILIWTGNVIAALAFFTAWWQILIALFGWICIVLIMMGSTKRLEKKQNERYGSDPKFQKYIKTVPVLFPWIPIYSLEKVKVYLE